MTRERAKQILGNQPTWALRNMARALAIHSWLNNDEEWERCEALRALGYRNAPVRPSK